MATIKIDRGFTQKIQQKGLVHSPAQEPSHQPKRPQSSKKTGAPVGLLIGVVAGVAAAVGVIAWLAFGRKEAPKLAAVPSAPPVAAVQPGEKKPEADELADPEMEIYKNHTAKPTQPAAASPLKQDFKTVRRDIPVGAPNGLLCEYYENISGKQISALRAHDDFPGRPSRIVQVGSFDLSDNVGDRYGARVRGYLVPPLSGTYRFSVCADDAVELWLSTDDTPAGLRKLVSYGAWIHKYQWTTRGDQQSAACELKAGQRYYLEAFVKEDSGSDYLCVAWKGPGSEAFTVIDGSCLQPWKEGAPEPSAASQARSGASPRPAREAAEAPARAAVQEQLRKHGPAYRYAEAADALKAGKAAWSDPQALAVVETAILRLELLGRLREFVQSELAKQPLRGVWTAFGGQADVTSASPEGITVAPGRIVDWAKVPPDQMLRLVNALVPKATADTSTKGVLFLAAAVFCKEVSGGLDLALKYRERALSNHSGVGPLAERVLGGSPEALRAEVRMGASRAELERLTASAAALAEKNAKQQAQLAAVAGLAPGLLLEYWEQNPYGSLSEVRTKGLLKKQPDSVRPVSAAEAPKEHAEKYVGRLSGYVAPSESGEYFFYIAADDQGELWLSTDESPDNLSLLVRTETHVNPRAWNKEKHRSRPVRLEKGRRYYLEGLVREGEKNDHLSLAWSLVSEDNPSVIEAANLLYPATAGFTPQLQALREQVEADLQKTADLLLAVARAQAADRAWSDSDQPASAAAAEELDKQVSGVREALRQAESLVQQADVALAKLRPADRPG